MKLYLQDNGTCTSCNLIYVIICTKCKLYYVGETSKSLNIRIKQHINHIINFIPFIKYNDKVIPKHFRSKNHSLSNFRVCIFKNNIIDTKMRKEKELDLINFLNLKEKVCLNDLITNNSKSFIFN